MQSIKPFVAVSRKGVFATFFDTEDEASVFAKQKATDNFVTMAVARVTRTFEPDGTDQARVTPPSAIEAMPAAPLTIPAGATSLVEVGNG